MTPEEHHTTYLSDDYAQVKHLPSIARWNDHMGRRRESCAGCPYVGHPALRSPCRSCPVNCAYIPAVELDAFNIWKATQHDL